MGALRHGHGALAGSPPHVPWGPGTASVHGSLASGTARAQCPRPWLACEARAGQRLWAQWLQARSSREGGRTEGTAPSGLSPQLWLFQLLAPCGLHSLGVTPAWKGRSPTPATFPSLLELPPRPRPLRTQVPEAWVAAHGHRLHTHPDPANQRECGNSQGSRESNSPPWGPGGSATSRHVK